MSENMQGTVLQFNAASSTTKVVKKSDLTAGKRIKQDFLNKQKEADPAKYAKYEKIAIEKVAGMIADLDAKVAAGSLPITQVSLDQTESGIKLTGSAAQDYLKDDLFNMILQEKAKAEDLVLEVQMVMAIDPITKQQKPIPILICTIK